MQTAIVWPPVNTTLTQGSNWYSLTLLLTADRIKLPVDDTRYAGIAMLAVWTQQLQLVHQEPINTAKHALHHVQGPIDTAKHASCARLNWHSKACMNYNTQLTQQSMHQSQVPIDTQQRMNHVQGKLTQQSMHHVHGPIDTAKHASSSFPSPQTTQYAANAMRKQ